MVNVVYCDNNDCLKNNYYFALSSPSASNPTQLHPSRTGIADSGASGFFFAPDAPVSNRNHKAPTIGVRVANGLPEQSAASATLSSVPSLPAEAMQGHVMPSFPNTLIGLGLGPFADLGCKIVFTKTAVSVIHPDGHSILEGWRGLDGPRHWMFPLDPPKPSKSGTLSGEPPSGNICLKPSQRGSAANFSKSPLANAINGANEASLPPPVPTPETVSRFQKPPLGKPTETSSGFQNPPLVKTTETSSRLQKPPKPIKRLNKTSKPPSEPPQTSSLLHPSQGIHATDNSGQAFMVTYMFGAAQANGTAQAMALASLSAKKPFDPRTLNLPSIPALVGFYHACLGFPVKQTWLEAIKAGNFETFEGLTYSNAARYCPDADETILGHLAQQRQNVRSTKPKGCNAPPPPPADPETTSNNIFIRIYPISKLYTDDTGRFPIKAQSGNQYVMISHHANGNLILQQAFKTRSDKHRIAAYNAIMTRLTARGLSVDLQILDNEASAAYKQAITGTWNCKFQLVPPDMHRRNHAEIAIRTFKDHFLAILAGVDATFPPYLWDLLLPQAELTLNLLRQSTVNPRISAWEFFQGPFDFNKTPLGPVGCRVLIHAKPVTRRSWDFRAKAGFYIGPAMDSYRCFRLVKSNTKSQVISDTVKFRHAFCTIPAPTPEDKIIHGLQTIAGALKDTPLPTTITQLDAIANLRELFEAWRLLPPPLTTKAPPRVHDTAPPRVATPAMSPPSARTPSLPPFLAIRTPSQSPQLVQAVPRRLTFADTPPPQAVALSPRVINDLTLPPQEPIAHRTRSRVPSPPLALFAGNRHDHNVVTFNMPTPKATRALSTPMGFAGLCQAYALDPKEVEGFANLCKSLEDTDCMDMSALSVLDPSTGELLEHRQLR